LKKINTQITFPVITRKPFYQKGEGMNRKLLGLLLFGVFMGAMDIAVLGPVIHAIEKTFHITSREIIWILNTYILANLISTPMLASLSDLYGRKMVYVYSVFLFGVGSLLVIFSPNFWLILLGRGIQGFGSGGFFPIASSVIGDTFPKEKQGSALGYLGAVYGLGFIVGPLIGGVLLLLDWRWVFVLNLPMAAVLILYSLKLLPSKRSNQQVEFDWIGMFLLAVSLALFAFSINRINTNDFFNSLISPKILPYLIISLIILPFFFKHQKKSRDPVINLELFKSRPLGVAYFIAFGTGLGEAGLMFLPGFLKEAFSLSYSNASFALIPMVIAILFGALFAGWMIGKIDSKHILSIGGLFFSVGLLGIWNSSENKSLFYLAESLFGFGLSTVLGAPLRFIVNSETSEEIRASGQGLLTIFNSIGLIISSSLTGALVASLGGGIPGYKGAFLLLAVICISLIFIPFLIKRKITTM
jgi:MFS family permease